MSKPVDEINVRLALARSSGVPISGADETRIAASVKLALDSLGKATAGSLFDTEPASFDRLLKEKSGKGKP